MHELLLSTGNEAGPIEMCGKYKMHTELQRLGMKNRIKWDGKLPNTVYDVVYQYLFCVFFIVIGLRSPKPKDRSHCIHSLHNKYV